MRGLGFRVVCTTPRIGGVCYLDPLSSLLGRFSGRFGRMFYLMGDYDHKP